MGEIDKYFRLSDSFPFFLYVGKGKGHLPQPLLRVLKKVESREIEIGLPTRLSGCGLVPL